MSETKTATYIARVGESQLRRSSATQLAVHTGCFSVSVIHRPLTRTPGSLSCVQMLMREIAHGGGGGGEGGFTDTVRESALKVDSGRKIPCRTGESNLRQRRACPTVYHTN